jgi:hypothetical protein
VALCWFLLLLAALPVVRTLTGSRGVALLESCYRSGALATGSPHRLMNAAFGLIGVFLPGLLILTGVLPFWEGWRQHAAVQATMRGIDAAVVSLLAAVLCNPLCPGTGQAKRSAVRLPAH